MGVKQGQGFCGHVGKHQGGIKEIECFPAKTGEKEDMK